MSSGGQLVCAGLVIYGHQTRVWLAGDSGCSQYILDRRVGQLVTIIPEQETNGNTPLLSTPDTFDTAIREKVDMWSKRSAGKIKRRGFPSVDFVKVLRNSGVWVSDPDMGLLYSALPMAFIAEKLGCQVFPDVLNSERDTTQLHKSVQIMVFSKDQSSVS